MAADDTVTKLVGLFVYHRSRGGSAVVPKLYQAHVAQLLLNSNEEVYRLQLCTSALDVERAENASILACSFLGRLYTPNHSTVAGVSMQQELVLDDVEDEEILEEAAIESKPITLGAGVTAGPVVDGSDGNVLTQDENESEDDDEDSEEEEEGDESGVDQGEGDGDGTMDEGEDSEEEEDDGTEGEGEGGTRVAGILLGNMEDGDGTNEDDMLQDILEAQASLIVSNNATSAEGDDAPIPNEVPAPAAAPAEPEYTSNRSKRTRR